MLDRIPAATCRSAPLERGRALAPQIAGLMRGRRAPTAEDARGVSRPQGAACDAGAVEVQR